MPLFMTPSPWDSTHESVCGTLENMLKVALARTTSKMEAAKLVQDQYAPCDVRMHPALRAGVDLGKAALEYFEGNHAALDVLKKR